MSKPFFLRTGSRTSRQVLIGLALIEADLPFGSSNLVQKINIFYTLKNNGLKILKILNLQQD